MTALAEPLAPSLLESRATVPAVPAILAIPGQRVRPVRPAPHAVCDEGCARLGRRQIGRTQRAGRWVAGAAAVANGALLVAVTTAVPGPGRIQRGIWARKRAARWVLTALGVRLEVRGAPVAGPSLLVGNHVSFLDLLVLAATVDTRMVAKDDVASWPVVGRVARQTGALFLDRQSLRALPDAVAEMTTALRSGFRVQVFPEATTRCGTAVNSFKRAAFQAAVDAGVVVSPFSLRYSDEDGPSTAVAFLGEETLIDCLRRIVRSGGLTASLSWLRPVPAPVTTGVHRAADRKAAAHRAERAVARALDVPVRKAA